MSILPKNRFKKKMLNQEENYNKTSKEISMEVLSSLEYDLIFQMYEKDISNQIYTSEYQLPLIDKNRKNKQK